MRWLEGAQEVPWILATTKPNSEAIAADNLQRQGYEPYCPRFLQKRPNLPPRIIPLFPRYIFIKIISQWYNIRHTRGMHRVLLNETGPQIVPETDIARLRRREDSKGLFQLSPKPAFANGAKVKTLTGVLAGQLLIYDGMTGHERCRVLVDMLGMKVRAELEEKLLTAA